MNNLVRKLIGRFYGFQAQIDTLTEKLQELSWDKVFGMWTRTAFLQFCRIMPRGQRTVVFVDLDRIHSLNRTLGYSEVDKRVKCAFSIPLRSSDIVARWYSGDEIVILFDNDRDSALAKVHELELSAAAQGLTFTHEIGTWNVGVESIVDVVDGLSSANRLKQESGGEAGREPGER
jgi:diguanylate cyclase (GGDEF)-like protein